MINFLRFGSASLFAAAQEEKIREEKIRKEYSSKAEQLVTKLKDCKLDSNEQKDVIQNASFGFEVIDHVLRKIKYVETWNASSEKELERCASKVEKCRKKHREENSRANILYNAKVAESHQAGNCHEMALIGFKYLLEKSEKKSNLRFSISILKNHVFLVIGIKDKPNIQIWPCEDSIYDKDLGKTAILCDIWAKKVYHVSEINTELSDLDGRDNQLRVVCEPFFRSYLGIVQQDNPMKLIHYCECKKGVPALMAHIIWTEEKGHKIIKD